MLVESEQVRLAGQDEGRGQGERPPEKVCSLALGAGWGEGATGMST